MGSFILHTTQSSLHFDEPQKNEIHSLILKAPITTAADDIINIFSLVFFSEKIRLDVSSESSARQRIHMKNQALLS